MNIKQYIVEPKTIGRGHFGAVFRGFDPKTKNKVAIKRIRSHFGEKEAKILKQAKPSPYLPTFYDFFIIDDYSYVVMGYIDGENLNSITGKWEEKKAVQITINILKGIQKIHEIGYIHNDILKKNIMIKNSDPETIKVYDLNLAKEIKGKVSVLKDLVNTAEVCMRLLYETLPKKITDSEKLELLGKMENKELMKLLMKAMFPTEENQYRSAEEFIKDLLPFTVE